ncbi:MAG: aspartate kinase [Myxococcota bacterium]
MTDVESTPIVVQKYGGSSVADPDMIQTVAERVVARRQAGKNLVVVVSAMGKATDDLLSMARRVASEPDRRELDMLLTVGERVSMALLAMAIRARGLEAVSLTGSQSGILTSASHTRARVMEVRPFRILDELERGRIVIVAGYQGVSYQREITSLGRGGSDTTAVALAAALNAEACEIYSDVDGVLSADPRVVPEATRLAELDYDSMQAMARAGAKVLNAQAVAFAKDKGIAIYARKTGSAEAGTVVRRDAPQLQGPTAVAHARNQWLVQEGPQVPAGLIRRSFRNAGGTWVHLVDGVDLEGPPGPKAIAVGTCTLIGVELDHRQAEATLSSAGLELDLAWATEMDLSFVVDEARVEDGVRALHATCVHPSDSG